METNGTVSEMNGAISTDPIPPKEYSKTSFQSIPDIEISPKRVEHALEPEKGDEENGQKKKKENEKMVGLFEVVSISRDNTMMSQDGVSMISIPSSGDTGDKQRNSKSDQGRRDNNENRRKHVTVINVNNTVNLENVSDNENDSSRWAIPMSNKQASVSDVFDGAGDRDGTDGIVRDNGYSKPDNKITALSGIRRDSGRETTEKSVAPVGIGVASVYRTAQPESQQTSSQSNNGSLSNESEIQEQQDGKKDVMFEIVDANNWKFEKCEEGDEASDGSNKEEKGKEKQKMTGIFEVFRFSDCLDRFLMIMGTIMGCCHGAGWPVMIIVFGEMIDLFVDSGKYSDTVDYLDSTGVITTLNLTKSAVMQDATLLQPHYEQIKILTNGTVDFNILNQQVQNDLLDTMTRYAVYFCIIGAVVIVVGWGQFSFWMTAAERQSYRIRKIFFRNILRQEIGWFDCYDAGELNTRLTVDINKISDGIGEKLGTFFQWFTAFLASLIIGFVRGWKLTLVLLATAPVLAVCAGLETKLVSMFVTKELAAYAKAGSVAEEVLSAIRTVIAFGGQKKECQRYNEKLTEARDFGIKKGFITGLSMGLEWFMIFCVHALGFWYGAKLVREDENYTLGNVLIVFFSVIIAAFALGYAAPNLRSLGVARGAAYTVYNLIDQILFSVGVLYRLFRSLSKFDGYRLTTSHPSIDSASNEGLKPTTMTGTIRFHDVYFKYPSRPDAKVLNGVNLEVNRGQTVALVGASGCGKSTVVQLIQRFYDPESGKVTLDGNDLKDLNVKWLRQHIGIVSQEPVLFGTTIEENIRYGRDDVTLDEIKAAATLANAHDFIMKLPDKYDTLVGERGAQLSGGQKQRVAIARALVRDPKLLLLDEATSALDTESEGVVQDALEKASHGRTTIVIAHRLSTIKTADLICGFKDGKVVETGSHDELMKRGGIYNTLVTLQTKQTTDDLEVDEYENPEPEKLKSVEKPQLLRPKSSIKRSVSKSGEQEDVEETKKEEEKPADASLKRILRLNAPEWPSIMLGCVGSLFNGGVMPAYAIIFAEIIGVFAETDEAKQEKDVNMFCAIFVATGVGSWIFMFLQAYMFGRSGENLTRRIRQLSFKAMLRQDVSYFDDHKNSTGALTTRLATDASKVQGASGIRLGTTLQSIVSILTGVIIAFIYGWQLTLVILCFLPFILIGSAIQMNILTGVAGKNKEALEEAGKVTVESVENIRTVASLSKEDTFYENYCKQLVGPHIDAMKKAHIIGISFSFSQAVIFFCYAASFWFGAYLIEEGVMNFTDVFKVFSAIVFGGMAVGEASSFAPDASKAKASAVQIFTLLDNKPAIDSESTEGEQPKEGQFTSAVALHNVHFRYPTRPDVLVLNGIDINVEPGKTVALVGSSGCGKSTTVQLIERFYDPEDGHVMLDRYDTLELNVQWLRRQIGIVSQEPVLFDRSIAENIAYGDNDRVVPMEEIIAAARSANIHNFIQSLPNGYDTNAGDKGSQLSGGQKQRIAIARALIRNPKILLLDEATSALDTESEKIVQEALDKAREGRTCIVIAHRLSTIQNADNIYVIRHGVVTEQGRHNDLMAKQGFYYKLNMAQARKK